VVAGYELDEDGMMLSAGMAAHRRPFKRNLAIFSDDLTECFRHAPQVFITQKSGENSDGMAFEFMDSRPGIFS
jgi:hypothetical protein